MEDIMVFWCAGMLAIASYLLSRVSVAEKDVNMTPVLPGILWLAAGSMMMFTLWHNIESLAAYAQAEVVHTTAKYDSDPVFVFPVSALLFINGALLVGLVVASLADLRAMVSGKHLEAQISSRATSGGVEQAAVHHFKADAIEQIPDPAAAGCVRQLRSGREVPSLADVVNITMTTHCPAKWAIVDLETGDLWGHDGTQFRRLTASEAAEVSAVSTWQPTTSANVAHVYEGACPQRGTAQ